MAPLPILWGSRRPRRAGRSQRELSDLSYKEPPNKTRAPICELYGLFMQTLKDFQDLFGRVCRCWDVIGTANDLLSLWTLVLMRTAQYLTSAWPRPWYEKRRYCHHHHVPSGTCVLF